MRCLVHKIQCENPAATDNLPLKIDFNFFDKSVIWLLGRVMNDFFKNISTNLKKYDIKYFIDSIGDLMI